MGDKRVEEAGDYTGIEEMGGAWSIQQFCGSRVEFCERGNERHDEEANCDKEECG